MSKELTQGTLMKVLDWSYDKAVDGLPFPGFDSAIKMAEDYLNRPGNLEKQVDSLIGWQNPKAFVSGFVTGLGGLPLLPFTVSADITCVVYIHVRMIAAIAYMGDHDLHDDRVKSLVYLCLCGNATNEVAKEIGIKIGTKLTQQAIKNISGDLIVKINQAVGFRLLTKFGQTGAVNIGKAIPVVGGIIGGTFDVFVTKLIGKIAKKTFINPTN